MDISLKNGSYGHTSTIAISTTIEGIRQLASNSDGLYKLLKFQAPKEIANHPRIINELNAQMAHCIDRNLMVVYKKTTNAFLAYLRLDGNNYSELKNIKKAAGKFNNPCFVEFTSNRGGEIVPWGSPFAMSEQGIQAFCTSMREIPALTINGKVLTLSEEQKKLLERKIPTSSLKFLELFGLKTTLPVTSENERTQYELLNCTYQNFVVRYYAKISKVKSNVAPQATKANVSHSHSTQQRKEDLSFLDDSPPRSHYHSTFHNDHSHHHDSSSSHNNSSSHGHHDDD